MSHSISDSLENCLNVKDDGVGIESPWYCIDSYWYCYKCLQKRACDFALKSSQIVIRTSNLPGSYITEYAGDLRQSAVLRVLTYLPNFDPSRGKLENFLSLHILGQVKDNGRKTEGYSRHRKGRFHIFSLCATLPDGTESPESLIPDIHINTEVEAVATESSRIVRDLLNELDERSRLILKLYYFEDLSMREIAEMLGVTESNMSQIITRLIGYILKLLNQRGIYNIRDISC